MHSIFLDLLQVNLINVTLKLLFCGKKMEFSKKKKSLGKYNGFNRTLILKDFKFIAEFLDQTEGGKRDNKGRFSLLSLDLFRMLKIQSLSLF